jgi:hypothetical protein
MIRCVDAAGCSESFAELSSVTWPALADSSSCQYCLDAGHTPFLVGFGRLIASLTGWELTKEGHPSRHVTLTMNARLFSFNDHLDNNSVSALGLFGPSTIIVDERYHRHEIIERKVQTPKCHPARTTSVMRSSAEHLLHGPVVNRKLTADLSCLHPSPASPSLSP